jgi:hypothetical protein
MNKEEALEIINEVKAIPGNVKGEVIVAGLVNAALDPNDIDTTNDGSFKRPFRKDILKMTTVESDYDEHSLNILLSRNGIYDLLPEGFCHKQDPTTNSTKVFSEYCKKRKKEEENCRKFFWPIESEYVNQLVKLEQKEQELLYNPSTTFYDFLADFWMMDKLPQPYEGILLHLLPFMQTIAGDFKLICRCLQELFKVPVEYKMEHRSISFGGDKESGMGNARLGRNFMAGAFVHALPYVVFVIGPVKSNQLKDFLEGGEINKFLQKFYKYAVPFEVDVETKVLSEKFVRTEGDPTYGVMGYSSCL